MKNKVLIGSIVTTLLAFMLYAANLRRVEHTNLEIVGQNKKEVLPDSKAKKKHELKVPEVEYPNQIKVEAGSEQVWAKKIEKVMGKDRSYQVSVQDLNNGKYARVANSVKAHGVGASSRIFLLAASYYQEQEGKLAGKAAVKVKKAEAVKGDKVLQPGIAYALTFIRQSMMQGSQTAGNVLLDQVKPTNVDQVAKKMGASDTKFATKYTASPLATTTAADLGRVLINLYQNKTLKRQYASLALGQLNQAKNRPKVVHTSAGTIYAIGDSKANLALVETHGRVYCVSVWSENDQKFTKLGETIKQFF